LFLFLVFLYFGGCCCVGIAGGGLHPSLNCPLLLSLSCAAIVIKHKAKRLFFSLLCWWWQRLSPSAVPIRLLLEPHRCSVPIPPSPSPSLSLSLALAACQGTHHFSGFWFALLLLLLLLFCSPPSPPFSVFLVLTPCHRQQRRSREECRRRVKRQAGTEPLINTRTQSDAEQRTASCVVLLIPALFIASYISALLATAAELIKERDRKKRKQTIIQHRREESLQQGVVLSSFYYCSSYYPFSAFHRTPAAIRRVRRRRASSKLSSVPCERHRTSFSSSTFLVAFGSLDSFLVSFRFLLLVSFVTGTRQCHVDQLTGDGRDARWQCRGASCDAPHKTP
jgi:hypothetical protein